MKNEVLAKLNVLIEASGPVAVNFGFVVVSGRFRFLIKVGVGTGAVQFVGKIVKISFQQ